MDKLLITYKERVQKLEKLLEDVTISKRQYIYTCGMLQQLMLVIVDLESDNE